MFPTVLVVLLIATIAVGIDKLPSPKLVIGVNMFRASATVDFTSISYINRYAIKNKPKIKQIRNAVVFVQDMPEEE